MSTATRPWRSTHPSISATRPTLHHCGQVVIEGWGQSLLFGDVVLSCSWRCDGCKTAREEDPCALPAEVREELLRQHGAWGVRVGATDRVKARAATREALAQPLSEVATRLRDGAPLAEGTRIEMLWLGELLTRRGITDVEVTRLDEPG